MFNKRYLNSLKRLKEIFNSDKIPWMVVSGAAVYFHNNPQRELTDIDTVVKFNNLSEAEKYLKKFPDIDNLGRVSFLNKFGKVKPLTSYLRLFISGIEIHISTRWIYEYKRVKIVIPYDNHAFKSSRLIPINGFEIRVAKPELVFLAKSITRRSFQIGDKIFNKDLHDCELLVKGNNNFSFDELKKLYVKLDLIDLYRRIALPLRKKYNR